ncbi:MAG: M28 family peptidase [Acidobacteria bacterium]|nr:M28 family peptidase [Acidobacteriota bacterium]
MKPFSAAAIVLAGLAAARAGRAEERVVPFWPNAVPETIRSEVDGNAALETVRELGRFHRVHGSPGYAAAARHMREKALRAGLSNASIEHFPANGKTRYAHFRSYPGWDPVEAVLEETVPSRVLARFPEVPVALADYSQDADVTAELVDVGAGTDAAHYAGKDVRGKIVLADGDLPGVHRRACEERGAAGFLSDFPNQTTAWSGDDRDLVRWGHLSPYQAANRFAFMISRRQAEGLRRRLAAGEKITLHAKVKARMTPATYDVVVATIPGTDPAAGEIVLTAHLCHQSAGANDNASGSAAIFEAARALQSAISGPPSRAGAAPGGRDSHGHGGRPALDDEGNLSPVENGRDAAPRRERDRPRLARPRAPRLGALCRTGRRRGRGTRVVSRLARGVSR